MICTCVYCGKEFKHRKYRRFCSTGCDKAFKENSYKERIHQNYPNYRYVGGYINSDASIKVQCKKCGAITEFSCITVRKRKPLICITCEKIEQENKAKEREAERERLRAIKAQERKNREAERRIKRCHECGKQFESVRHKYCSTECRNKHKNRVKEIKRRHKLKENGKINWNITLHKLIKRDNNTCHICGSKCNSEDYIIDDENNFIVGPDYPSIDHVIPVSKGGTHTWDNVKLAHMSCNTIKSNDVVYEDYKGQLTLAI